jgi:hypothetical protein
MFILQRLSISLKQNTYSDDSSAPVVQFPLTLAWAGFPRHLHRLQMECIWSLASGGAAQTMASLRRATFASSASDFESFLLWLTARGPADANLPQLHYAP